jgi:hypothetical protein
MLSLKRSHYDRGDFGQSLSKCLINRHENEKSGPKAAFL